MRILCVHPGPLMYTRIFLRLEPLGLELVAAALRQAGHEVGLIDLQVETHRDFFGWVDRWRPDVILFSCNYLANVPEIVDLAKGAKVKLPRSTICVGGHSASFVADALIQHGEGAIDCVVRGEGEAALPLLLAAVEAGSDLAAVPGAVTASGKGAAPGFVHSLDELLPARDLLRHRRKYFLGVLDPCASIEFSRGCPWDCSFCSAWTFYGRNYRTLDPKIAAEDLASIHEPGVFIVDDVAFIHSDHGLALAREIERRNIRKQYYLETRGDVLLRNKEIFRMWKRLGLKYMFLGIEAIDDEGLKSHRKRVTVKKNIEALECARALNIHAAVNIIADPNWDERHFEAVREWALQVPEIVHITVNTPYPGTETWVTESRNFTSRDYRLFDVQHAVLPTKLPLDRFYEELVRTQQILNQKHLGFAALKDTFFMALGFLAKGQTNFVKMLWKFSSVYNAKRQMQDHQREIRYPIRLPEAAPPKRVDQTLLYIHTPETAHASHEV